jgi:hypothetical protein
MAYHAAVSALLAAVALLAGPALRLELVPTKRTILVDEPLVVTVMAAGRGDVQFGDETAPLSFVIEEGHQSRRYMRKHFAAVQRESPRSVALGGRPLLWDVVLGFDGETNDWAFPRAGRYRLTAVYDEPGGLNARSNTVTIEVREPEGAEAEAHEALSALRVSDLAVAVNEQDASPELEAVAARHPTSAYVYLPRAYGLIARVHKAAQGKDPSVRAPQGDIGDAAKRQELARHHSAALRPLVEEMAETRGPLQPDLLLSLANLARVLGDYSSHRALLRRVSHQFPHRPAGERAARELKSLKNDEKIRRQLVR